MTLTVLQVANRHGDIVVTLPRPARHHNLLTVMSRQFAESRPSGGYHPRPEDQGFLLSDGTYATREEAANIARAAGQVTSTMNPDKLYSEDLW
jgi:hypothetical protein